MSRTKREWEEISRYITRLQEAGVSQDDAWALRRISMTLRRWFEMECGNSNDYGSWCIVRGRKVTKHSPSLGAFKVFEHDDDGDSYMEYHFHRDNRITYTRIPDREKGARKRLQAIMARYPHLQCYIQGDPRGCALYVIHPNDNPEGLPLDTVYNRGIAVF